MTADAAITATRLTQLEKFFRKKLLKLLSHIQHGKLLLHEPFGRHCFGDEQEQDLIVTMRVKSGEFYRRVALAGSIGAAESYMAGQWQADDLVKLVQLLVRNREVLDEMDSDISWFTALKLKADHYFNKNSANGSKKNIAAHYDLGNEFFELFLDSTMMYSSAVYRSEVDSLDEASARKLKLLADRLSLKPGDHLLEIGTGWGGFALFAATQYGCQVTTTTISEQQYQKAKQRIEAAGLQHKITLLKKDYRELVGEFDKVVSIEMIEAVGHHYLQTYFDQISARLKPGGKALLQAITIEDHRYQQALSSVDFIKRHIFPGSFIPCVSVMVNAAAKSRLRLLHCRDIGYSYALTLKAWRQRFLKQREKLLQLGYDEPFQRLWEFYLAYCEGGFREGSISNVHLLFARPSQASLTPMES